MSKGDKYKGLHDFLIRSKLTTISLTFIEIEKINGTVLPVSAQKHAEAWWSNNYDHSQAIAWLEAGYETDFVSDTFKENRIVFVKK